MQRTVLLTAALLFAASANAQSRQASVTSLAGAPRTTPGTVPARATATAAAASRAVVAPVLDGRADDEAWQGAQVIDQFLEYTPNEGKESRFRTEMRVTYDDKNLYVLARM